MCSVLQLTLTVTVKLRDLYNTMKGFWFFYFIFPFEFIEFSKVFVRLCILYCLFFT